MSACVQVLVNMKMTIIIPITQSASYNAYANQIDSYVIVAS